MHLSALFQSRLAQLFDKPIPIILENGLAVIAPVHHACPAVAGEGGWNNAPG
jgi:hypothetical protein